MGFCYDQATGQLCCDYCGAHGQTRRFKCPFDNCGPVAACPACRKAHAADFSKKTHRARGCEQHHLEFVAHNQEHDRLIAEGKYVRRSAIGEDTLEGYQVKVTFEGKDGYLTFYMSKETYSAYPLLENRTIEDYQAVGELTPAPVWSASKEVHFA